MRKPSAFAAWAGAAALGACQPMASDNAGGGTSATAPANDAAAGKPAAEPITAQWFAGRWSTDSDCSSIATFSPDGRFVNTVGDRGTWAVADNQLTLTVDGQSATIPLIRIGDRIVEGVGARGNTRQYRC